jgi:transcriptional regulator with XRE-family HTH domain
MAQVKRNKSRRENLRRQTPRSLRTFLLVQQFAAEEIGARIKQARKERGLTQEELAEMASFSTRSLQDYENGVTIPYRHMAEISRLLGRPVEWFLYGDGGGEPDELTAKVERIEALLEELLRRRQSH